MIFTCVLLPLEPPLWRSSHAPAVNNSARLAVLLCTIRLCGVSNSTFIIWREQDCVTSRHDRSRNYVVTWTAAVASACSTSHPVLLHYNVNQQVPAITWLGLILPHLFVPELYKTWWLGTKCHMPWYRLSVFSALLKSNSSIFGSWFMREKNKMDNGGCM